VPEGGGGIAEEHYPEARKQQVVGLRGKLGRGGVGQCEIDGAMARLAGALEELGRYVETEHPALGAHPVGQHEAGRPGAAADVEHMLARERVGSGDRGFTEGRQHRIKAALVAHPVVAAFADPVADLINRRFRHDHS
jgi:hypothetical protein